MNDDSLKHIPEELLTEHLELSERLAELQKKETIQTNFLPFVKTMWSDFIEGEHHRIMARAFDRIASGELKRLIINMPPRHTKSEFASYMFPAYLVGKRPGLKIIQATHTADLAVRFGRKIRDLVDSKEYQDVFPNVELNPESKAAGRWETRTKDGTMNGEYFASGVGGALAGRGADLSSVLKNFTNSQEAFYHRLLTLYKARRLMMKFQNNKSQMTRILFLENSRYIDSEHRDPPCMCDLYIKTSRWFPVLVPQKILQQKFK